MGESGKKDKGGRENRKKPKLPSRKSASRNTRKRKSIPGRRFCINKNNKSFGFFFLIRVFMSCEDEKIRAGSKREITSASGRPDGLERD